MRRWALRALFGLDRACFALFRARLRHGLAAAPGVSPNLRLAHVRIEPGARLEVGPGFATERQAGNRIWIQAGGLVRLERDVWLRTEYGPNWLTVFPGGRLILGERVLVNGAMLHAKTEVRMGADSMIGLGARVFDADLHDLDCETPERTAPVRIGERVWIGSNAIVLRGVTIGDDTIVGAGSIVTRDLPARVLALGAPARPVREIASRAGCR